MSDQLIIDDPFALNPIEEETELRALVRALEFSEGFKLLFARCNQPQQRQRLMEQVQARLPQEKVQVISLSEPVTHLLDTLQEVVRQPSPDAIFITGLEYSLPIAAEAHNAPFIANLNASRNSFFQFDRPLVFWIPEYVLSAIMLGAPDFFSIRSGTYSFVSAPDATSDVATALTAGLESIVDNMTWAEKQERITAINSLLADYEMLPAEQRDKRIEMRLHMRLGNLFHALEQYEQALNHLNQALTISIELQDREYEGWILGNIGIVYASQSQFHQAVSAYEKSLDISRELNDRLSEAHSLVNLGIIHFRQANYKKAEEKYLQALQVYKEIGDESSEGTALANLALVYESLGLLSEAETSYQEGLAISRKFGDHRTEANAMFNLGTLYLEQGKSSEAEVLLNQSLQISHRLGNNKLEKKNLQALAQLRRARGDSEEELKLTQ
ncbi:MAG TPA: tetratricopeptide repeat protein [Pyrinomonadaceae bacterium]|nr:tetratricopeptide repeat protein [Pyrinomonadaceae bacterium]